MGIPKETLTHAPELFAMALSRQPSKVEGIKERSQSLREPVATELLQDTPCFSEDGLQILKFHGSYQQDYRDHRQKGQAKDYQFMLRTRSPGGFIPPQLYLTLDSLADQYGNHTLRATTRQGFQIHGVLKRDLKTVIQAIITSMGSTLGACGDLNRNVMCPPAPYRRRPEYDLARHYAEQVANLLTPETGAYYEIWLDGEKSISAEAKSEGPLYGTYYLPRKFKIAVTVPGDNSVDLLSQDLGLVVLTNARGDLEGFNVYVGGGMGRTHGKEETFPRLADPLGFVPGPDIYDLVQSVVTTQRDYGDRTDRRRARMKYLVEDWGLERFKAEVERNLGRPLEAPRPLPEWRYLDFLGWHPQGDGKLFLGLPIANGRILDQEGCQLKTALRQIVSQYQLPLYLTPHQNLILAEVDPQDQAAIRALLRGAGVKETVDSLERLAMACPALPTCGLAITEAERVIPRILERLRGLMGTLSLGDEGLVVRVTGCPNGCARPYLAELALVGVGPDSYQVWLGASPAQTRLAQIYQERMDLEALETTLEPVLVYFRQARELEESFGDFCHRVGMDAISQFAAQYGLGQAVYASGACPGGRS